MGWVEKQIMPDESPKPDQTPNDEAKAKLRQIRADYTRAQNILGELETYYTSFDELRKKLDDDSDGLEVNLTWSQTKKTEMDALVAELETAAASIKTLVADVQAQHDTFVPLAAKLTDPNTGIDAMLTTATNLKDSITTLLQTATTDSQSATTALGTIQTRTTEVETAYKEFTDLMEEVNDTETGVAAQVAEVEQYAKDALKAKTTAESELASVISLKQSATEHVEEAKASKDEISGYKDESQTLTDDIRNTLGLTSAYSLSKAHEDQRKRLDGSLKWWGAAVALAILLLASALGVVFYTLFLDSSSKDIIRSIGGGNVFLTVVSKALFTSPFIFTLYFTTNNFSRTRDLRDSYLSKEIAAKNLQAYTKLLRDEFPTKEEERLNFALHNVQAIYDDPVTRPKKRSYNFGINKIFQFGVEEENAEQIKEKIIEGVEEIAKQSKTGK